MAEIDVELLKKAKNGLETAAQQIGNVIAGLSQPPGQGFSVHQFAREIALRETPRVAIRNAEEAIERIKEALRRGQN